MPVELLPTIKVKDGKSYRIINEADRKPEDELYEEPVKPTSGRGNQQPQLVKGE